MTQKQVCLIQERPYKHVCFHWVCRFSKSNLHADQRQNWHEKLILKYFWKLFFFLNVSFFFFCQVFSLSSFDNCIGLYRPTQILYQTQMLLKDDNGKCMLPLFYMPFCYKYQIWSFSFWVSDVVFMNLRATPALKG